ncbi:MAG: carboxymuconolactone decarboxylase family protein [Desulfatibacillaceae bacterium]
MALIKTVDPKEATGKVAEGYDLFTKIRSPVPAPFTLMSASPDLLLIQKQILGYFMSHKTLKFELLAHIRLLVADYMDYSYCIDFNTQLLSAMAGLDDDRIDAVKKDPATAQLEDRDKAMLLFVLKSVKEPETVTRADVDELHDKGWTDRDIFDAVYHGVGMVSAGILFKAFAREE